MNREPYIDDAFHLQDIEAARYLREQLQRREAVRICKRFEPIDWPNLSTRQLDEIA